MNKNFRIVTTITLAVILLSLIVIWIFGGVSRLSAEGSDETAELVSTTESGAVITMSVKQLTQDPKTLEIPLALSIYSTRNSDRVNITWELPKGIQIVGENSFFISVNTNAPTVIETRFKPVQAGRFDIRVKAEMFAAEVNYVSSASYTLAIGNSLETLPETEEYRQAKMEHQTKEFLKYAGIALGILSLIVFGYIAFKKWLNAED